MGRREYLESALNVGLMLTMHKVEYRPAVDPGTPFLDVFPLLETRLKEIGKPWENLTAGRQRVIRIGLGPMSGKIPMLCFTEVPEGRCVREHYRAFGGYGLVVRRTWLEANSADRVIYVGDGSAVSRRLYEALAGLLIATLSPDANGEVLFRHHALGPAFDLLAYIEVRDHVEEFEWRIAGRHGFLGGGNDTGKRLPIGLPDIEAVVVRDQPDISYFEGLVARLAATQGTQLIPVLHQPHFL
jgi:hypothetical protein